MWIIPQAQKCPVIRTMNRGMAPSHAIANGTGNHGNPFGTLRDQDGDHAPATAAVQTHWLVGDEPSAPSSGRLSSVLEDTGSTEPEAASVEVERLRTELDACRMLLARREESWLELDAWARDFEEVRGETNLEDAESACR